MIQRIQSVYLFLAALVSGGLVFLFPVFVASEALMITQYPIFMTGFLLSAALSLITVFRYKNRQTQVVLGRLNVILNFVLFGLILYMYFENFGSVEASLGLASFIPLIAVILISMANRAVMKDEALVRAADRLR